MCFLKNNNDILLINLRYYSILKMFCNDYYQSVGYSYAGKCSDGPYVGNKREKIIGRETKTVIGEMSRTDRDSLR